MERLSEATMLNLPSPASRPTYDRNLLKGGVVHVGVGRFHRAHQVPAFETLAEHGDYRWGIVGASLRSPAVRDRLRPQDYLYGLIVDDGQTRRSEVLGSLLEIIVAGDDRDRLLGAIASPDAHIVTVTVTEKGYKLDPASGALLTDDAAIRGDLANLASPRTLPGYLVAGLRRRKEHGLGPLTIISCDNMADNGHKLRSVVVEVARAHDPSLGEWIEERCCFPNTMVDRIVPAMTESDLDSAAALLKLIDRASVRTEPFMQWVIEDAFASARPELERAGVQFTANVAPWERAKLRLLNGAHSVMAYVGGLAGISTVHEFVAQPWARELLDRLWDEVQPTLATSTELNLADYRDQLMRRFANSALKHRLMQIAMDGSQKLPQRLVAPAVELIDKGHS